MVPPHLKPTGSAPRRDDLPPSPAFGTSSSLNRPDHSTVVLPSTSPASPPSASPPGTPASASFSDKYGGYGNTNSSERENLMSTPKKHMKRNSIASPKSTSHLKKLIKLFSLVVAVIILISLLVKSSVLPSPRDQVSGYIPQSMANLLKPSGKSLSNEPHPIIGLLTKANRDWQEMISSQSSTFDRASRVYKSRYRRSPPPGFEKWFAFATQARNHSLVDEYDALMQDLLPFRALSPQEIRRRTAELGSVTGISILSIRRGVAQVHSKSGKWAAATALQQMMASFVGDLPDMDIAVNEKPEGRVLPRRERVVMMSDYGLDGQAEKAINASDPMRKPSLKGFSPEWKRDGTVWDAFRRACAIDANSRRLVESTRSAEVSNGGLVVQGRKSSRTNSPTSRRRKLETISPLTREMSFNADLDAGTDMCDHPSLHTLHSAFYSDQRSIEYLYPVFSASKPAGFADILIPSQQFWAPSSEFTYELDFKKGRSQKPNDVEWHEKRASIYWRGKVTRGADTPPGHGSSFQKQRMVKTINHVVPGQEEKILVSFEPKRATQIAAVTSLHQLVNQTTDIAMACDPNQGECSYLRSLGYRVEPPAPLSDAWKHKYVLDLDEIGFSPKFFALMESKSAVIKSSIQKEFWRGWIQPWKHFIPLSSAYSELFNIQTFFSGFPQFLVDNSTTRYNKIQEPWPVPQLPNTADGKPFSGDAALRDIAEAGSEWRNKYARKADLECYVYRLMIEWAHILKGPQAAGAEVVEEEEIRLV